MTGEVRHADGQAVAKGVVQFIPESGPWRNISAGIKDGKFTLVTSFGNQVLSGATEGRYRVSIISGFDAHGAPIVNKLPNACEIKTQDNHFVFALPKGAAQVKVTRLNVPPPTLAPSSATAPLPICRSADSGSRSLASGADRLVIISRPPSLPKRRRRIPTTLAQVLSRTCVRTNKSRISPFQASQSLPGMLCRTCVA